MKENNEVLDEKDNNDSDEEEQLETCELYINLLIKNVEDMKKNVNPDGVSLDSFMSTYCELENKIITIVQNCHFKENTSNYQKMLELIELFNPYFGEYQDTWDQRFLDSYKKFAKKKYSDNNEIFLPNKETGDIIEGDNFLSNNDNFIFDEKDEIMGEGLDNTNNKKEEGKNKYGILNKIDEELDKVEDVGEIGNSPKHEKTRDSCLECCFL